MPLPSQVARPSAATGRSNMQRAKQPALKPILIGAGVVAVLALGGWAMMRGGQAAGAAKGPAAQTPQTKAPEIKPIEAAAPTPPDKILATNDAPVSPGPVEIHQGKGAGGNNSSGSKPPEQSRTELGHTAGADPKPAPTTAPPPAAPPPAPVNAPSLAISAPAEVQAAAAAGMKKLETGDPVGARASLSHVLADGRISETDRQSLRDEISTINDDLVFSPRVAKDDASVSTYAVQSGDSLIKIAQKLGLGPDYRFIARVNQMADLHSLREGQKLKVVKGPFHAIVNKSAYRLDLYMGPAQKQDEWVYIRSVKVGLGEANGTPVGTFVCKKGSKLIDPPWINPHTGEKFAGGDPKNPIGHRWIGLEGQGDSAKYTGYGLHGTIDPDSIGQQRSMGCVRMATADIELVWELLGVGDSVVKIVP